MSIAKDFVDALKEKKKTEAYDTSATVVRIEGKTAWVHLPGGIDETPVKLTMNAVVGETVQVRVSGGTAYLIGNASSPPTDDSTALSAKRSAISAYEGAVEAWNKAEDAETAASDAAKKATNYLSQDSTGIMVADMQDGQQTPSEATGRNVFIDADSVDIRDGQDVLASFGTAAQIGKSSASHSVIDTDGQRFYGSNGSTLLANIGYGEGKTESGRAVAPYYTFGTRKSGSAIGIYSMAEGINVTASGAYSHVEGSASTASGTDSHAEGVGATASDRAAHAEGTGTSASGESSHAEGNGTVASGDDSHAEGYSTTASHDTCHAEGSQTTASGRVSHAEGNYTMASGDYSHAEGSFTVASGESSHAEGSSTTASGYYSHAEGLHTEASCASQTVIGEYNEIDPLVTDGTERGQYALIIGNGTSENNRSNAFTVDWDGDAEAVSYNGYTLGEACEKNVDTTISSGSTSTNLPTSAAVEARISAATGTRDYDQLLNRPQINGVTLTGDKTWTELDLNSLSNIEIESMLS